MNVTARDPSGKLRARSVSDAVWTVVHDTNSERGELEDIAARIEKLAEMVGALVAKLPEPEQMSFLNEMSCQTWRRAE